MPKDAKHALAEFVINEVLDPVMKARPDTLEDADRPVLEHLQQATRAEIERYRAYGSAEEVLVNFRRDLTSRPAKKVHAELNRLGLPTLLDIRDRFEDLARSRGVHASSS
ncbi:hypothetical protein [Rhodopila sp.]|uniref:hypothetical protein n=1 Tax=Rhodopila sp. TaxID=2480087 RepID=UPI003D0F8917